jgi:RimJ/RimL family protein N-acetyltransferase
MTLAEKRRAIRPLLDHQDPADAMAVHYAFYHPDQKTQMTTYPSGAVDGKATGYVTVSRTGIDLFRPFVTLRLPDSDMEASVELIYSAIKPGAAVIAACPESHFPLLRALFDIQSEERLRLYTLDPNRFEPIINVLVQQGVSQNDLARFVVRREEAGNETVVAAAGLNWQTPKFAEISVNADPRFRRRGWGRSVLAAMVQHLLATGRKPLYVVSHENKASIQLAESVGFQDTGTGEIIFQAVLRPRP